MKRARPCCDMGALCQAKLKSFQVIKARAARTAPDRIRYVAGRRAATRSSRSTMARIVIGLRKVRETVRLSEARSGMPSVWHVSTFCAATGTLITFNTGPVYDSSIRQATERALTELAKAG